MPFWNEKRRRVYPRLIVAAVVIWTVAGFAFLWARAASRDDRYGGDFVVFWSAATIAREGHPAQVFDYGTLLEQERKTVPSTDLYPWHYPPQFLLVVRPFAEVPYPAALIVWTAAGLFMLVFAVQRIVGLSPGSVGLPLAGVVINAAFGQNGALTGAILGIGLPLATSRPFVGGTVLGLLTYKPHFAPVALLALVVTRNWRACAGAALSAGALAICSFVIFGPDTWRAFFDNGSTATHSLFEDGAWQQMPSPVAAVQLAGGTSTLAVVVQAMWSVGFLAVALMLVHKHGLSGPPTAGIVIATLAVSPYVYFYDTAALGVVVAVLLAHERSARLQNFERIAFAILALGVPFAWMTASAIGIQVGPLVFLLAMAIVVIRLRRGERAERPVRGTTPTVGIPYKSGFPVTK